MARSLTSLGKLALAEGDADQARGCWERSLAILEDIGVPEAAEVSVLLDDLADGRRIERTPEL